MVNISENNFYIVSCEPVIKKYIKTRQFHHSISLNVTSLIYSDDIATFPFVANNTECFNKHR